MYLLGLPQLFERIQTLLREPLPQYDVGCLLIVNADLQFAAAEPFDLLIKFGKRHMLIGSNELENFFCPTSLKVAVSSLSSDVSRLLGSLTRSVRIQLGPNGFDRVVRRIKSPLSDIASERTDDVHQPIIQPVLVEFGGAGDCAEDGR